MVHHFSSQMSMNLSREVPPVIAREGVGVLVQEAGMIGRRLQSVFGGGS